MPPQGSDGPLAPSCSRVMTYREHTAWVVKACLQKRPEGHIVSVRYVCDICCKDIIFPAFKICAWYLNSCRMMVFRGSN